MRVDKQTGRQGGPGYAVLAYLFTCTPHMVGRGGFEPPKALPADLQSAPFGRLGTCPYQIVNSDRRPTGLQGPEEPTAGLEPATVRLQGGCSTELSYVGLPYSRHCSTQWCLTKKNSCKPTAWQHYGSIRRSACFVKCQESEALKPITQSLPDHHR